MQNLMDDPLQNLDDLFRTVNIHCYVTRCNLIAMQLSLTSSKHTNIVVIIQLMMFNALNMIFQTC